jgi:hypothetical protein
MGICSSEVPLYRGRHKRQVNAIATLGLLTAINRQVRQKVRGIFWAKFQHDLRISGEGMSKFEVTQRYLLKIGREGRAVIPQLPFPMKMGDHRYPGYGKFRYWPAMLQPCISLRRLNLKIGVSHIFWADRDNVAAHLFTSEPPQSVGLDSFVAMIQSLPRLRELTLDMIPSFRDNNVLWRDEPNKFLQFLFSGMREFALYLAMYDRLNANHMRLQVGELEYLKRRSYGSISHRTSNETRVRRCWATLNGRYGGMRRYGACRKIPMTSSGGS